MKQLAIFYIIVATVVIASALLTDAYAGLVLKYHSQDSYRLVQWEGTLCLGGHLFAVVKNSEGVQMVQIRETDWNREQIGTEYVASPYTTYLRCKEDEQ